MEKEWRKIGNLNPAVLYKDDLIELVKIIGECEQDQYCYPKITFEYNESYHTLDSIEELENIWGALNLIIL